MNRFLADLVRRGAGIAPAREHSRVAPAAPGLRSEIDDAEEGVFEEGIDEALEDGKAVARERIVSPRSLESPGVGSEGRFVAVPVSDSSPSARASRRSQEAGAATAESIRPSSESSSSAAVAHRSHEHRSALRPVPAPAPPSPPASIGAREAGHHEVTESGRAHSPRPLTVRHVHVYEAAQRGEAAQPGAATPVAAAHHPTTLPEPRSEALPPFHRKPNPRDAEADQDSSARPTPFAVPRNVPSSEPIRAFESLIQRLETLAARFEEQHQSPSSSPLTLIAPPSPPRPAHFAEVALERRHSDRRWY